MSICGQCACGGVVVEIDEPVDFASHCHCATCRQVHAAAFVTWTGVPPNQLRMLQGEALLVDFCSSPGVHRSFCGRCGTHMIFREDGVRRAYLPVAVLRDFPTAIDSHVSFEERVGWLVGVEALPCFAAKGDQLLDWATKDGHTDRR